MDQELIKHGHAISSWIALRISRSGGVTSELTIETDLCLNEEDPNYEKDRVDSLIAAAVAYIAGRLQIGTIEIRPLQQGNLEVTSLGV